MALTLYNTLTRKKELFVPVVKGKVGMYNCGPTVYDYPHIGNYRAFMLCDILRRYLKYKGFFVNQVMNLTDVDDKTIKGSRREGITLKAYTSKYSDIFFEDLKTLNMEPAELYPRATDHIQEMVSLIEALMKKGLAYKGDDASIYFSVSKFKDYGKLSHIDLSDLKAGASGRVKKDEYEKGSVQDFALWKAYDPEDGEVFWETPIGKGRPGWHIECSAMSTKYLGQPFDIHTGGIDLMFPHHENETAQSEGAFGKKFVNYWVHNEHILVEGKKMSKSLGNFYTLRDLLKKGYDPIAIRYLLLSTHYRMQLNFTTDGITAAKNSLERLSDFVLKLRGWNAGKDNDMMPELILKTAEMFESEMDDDLNISNALAIIFEFVKTVNRFMMENNLGKKDAEKALALMEKLDTVLGVLPKKEKALGDDIQALVDKREEARKKKDFATADKIRDELKAKGIILEDSPQGIRWKKA